MSFARIVAAISAALALAGPGCEAPHANGPSTKPFLGVTFLGDKAHPVKIFHLSADGRAAVGYVVDAEKAPPPGSWTSSAAMPDYAHSFYWSEPGGLKIIRTRDGRDVEVRAISADGVTAVGRYYDQASRAHVFRWTQAGGIEDLGAPDGAKPVMCVEGGCGAIANTVSANGAVIFGTLGSLGSLRSFRWIRATGVRDLHVPGDITAATADGSTGVGVIFVEAGPDRARAHVFRWTQVRGFEDLGAPPRTNEGPQDFVSVNAVAADGSTIVGEYENQGWIRAYRWTRSSSFRDLLGEAGSEAFDVSGDGSQIIGRTFARNDSIPRAVRWLGDNPPQPIGPPTLRAEIANSISADGRTIAGRAVVGKGGLRAFLVRLK